MLCNRTYNNHEIVEHEDTGNPSPALSGGQEISLTGITNPKKYRRLSCRRMFDKVFPGVEDMLLTECEPSAYLSIVLKSAKANRIPSKIVAINKPGMST
jgi:hypothetical protein